MVNFRKKKSPWLVEVYVKCDYDPLKDCMPPNYEFDFTKTPAYSALIGFMKDINTSIIQNKERTKNEKFHRILDAINEKINQTECIDGDHRFANIAATIIHEFLEKINLRKYFHDENCTETREISDNDIISLRTYLMESFGNKIRLDYGTGHEINFLAFLYVARCCEILSISDVPDLFQKYFIVVRNFIYKYNIEPAGTLGCFAVDDYSYFPFFLGSAELSAKKYSEITIQQLLRNDKYKHFMYREVIDFCIEHKTRGDPYGSTIIIHPPMLQSFCEMPWIEVNKVMLEFIDKKVFRRYVAIQHFRYCRFLEK